MAYLEDFYPLDIDDSYLEYVISELKYDAIDILLLDCGLISEISKDKSALSPLTSSHVSE